MNQRSADQPRHERGVFHRIPEPPPAPTELVIGPPAAKGNTNGQKYPGKSRPGPGPAGPGRVEAAAKERCDGKRKGHRETHIADVQHRRVDGEARVLQQWIKVTPVQGRRHLAFERIGCQQQEKQKTDTDQPQNGEHPGHHLVWHAATEAGHGARPAAKDQQPKQQGALMRGPHARYPVKQGQIKIGIVGDVKDRKVMRYKCPGQAGIGDEHKQQLPAGSRFRNVHPGGDAPGGAGQRQCALDHRQAQRDDQSECADFRNHCRPIFCAFSRASLTSGGM